MYIESIPNRNSRPAILLREAWREGDRIRKKTVANLTDWPEEIIEGLRLLLKGKKLFPAEELFAIERTIPHGHVHAVMETIKNIGLDGMISAKPCRERDLVLAMIAGRLLFPCSKLATTRMWHTTTLAEELRVADADENELYTAMDWLLARQHRIENKLAARHLSRGGPVFYDVTSSYYEGKTCTLARHGHNRDGKKGLPIIVYGMLTDQEGRPVTVDVYPGNTGDPTTVPDQVEKMKQRFGLDTLILVGDRGMLTQTQIDKLKGYPGIAWISALRSHAIKKLVDTGRIQMSLFDETNLAEIDSPDFPGERLVACFNPLLAEERKRKREELLVSTEKLLSKLQSQVSRRTKTPLGKAEIAEKLGAIVNRYKMAKHFHLVIEDNLFAFSRRNDTIDQEASLDGIYVVRTSVPKEDISAASVVRGYKNLSVVERIFRTIKGVEILVRPIFHHLEDHVRAHIFLCMLAYYVEWHMRKALAPMLFDDEELDTLRKTRHPVKPAEASPSANAKKSAKRTADDLPVHSFKTLLAELATLCRNTCRITKPAERSFTQLTTPTPIQRRAFALLGCSQ
jgi:transposase